MFDSSEDSQFDAFSATAMLSSKGYPLSKLSISAQLTDCQRIVTQLSSSPHSNSPTNLSN